MSTRFHPILSCKGSAAPSLGDDTPKKAALKKGVTFSDVLCIRIGEDTSFAFQDFWTHVDALLSVLKPWTLDAQQDLTGPTDYGTARKTIVPGNRLHPILRQFEPDRRNMPVSNPSHEHPMHPTNPNVQMLQQPIRSSVCTEMPFMSMQTIDPVVHQHDAQLAFSDPLLCNRGTKPTAVRPFHMSLLSDIQMSLRTLDTHPIVASKATRHVPAMGRDTTIQPKGIDNAMVAHTESSQPSFVKVRREHESPIAHLVGPQQDGDDTEDEQMDEHDHPVLPAFVNYLTNRLEGLGLNPHDNDFDLAVRTWYIDHRTIHRWTAPRILQLVGPPRGWEAQIQSLWVDQLDNDDWFDAIIVEPDPPRLARHALVVYDMIVTQSLDMPRVASMVTVLPGRADTFQMYSVACSLPEVVSGYELVQAADAGRHCRHAECLITYRWIQIPNTLRPTHQVGHGDGFQIVVHDQERIPLSRHADDASSSEAITTSPTYSPGRHAQAASSNQPARFTTMLHLFQLEGIEVCCQVLNDQRVLPTQEIADALHIPLDCLEAIHVMPHTPFQMPEYDMVAVVQRTGDLTPNTMDRLMLVDIVYHHHPDSEGVTHRPTLVREVQRVGHQILRQQILLAAAVHHYCILVTTQCAVTFDGVLWPEHEHSPRPVHHGSYAQVIVPPPPTHDIPTQMAVEVTHQTAENADAQADLLGPSSADDDIANAIDADDVDSDDVQLTQVAAQHRNVASFQTRLPADADQLPKHKPAGKQTLPARIADDLPPKARPLQVEGSTQCVGQTLTSTSPKTANTVALEEMPTDDVRPIQAQPSLGDPVAKPCTEKRPKQLTITSFFKAPQGRKVQTEAKKQTTIGQFFKVKPNRDLPEQQSCLDVLPSASDPLGQESVVVPIHDPVAHAQAVQARTGYHHEAEPPTFEARVPAQPANPEAPPPRPIWHIELNIIFLEEAITHRREVGPEMPVEVWYVHHADMPICRHPRLIRLDDIRDLWYADLCNAWFDQLRRHQPVRVHIVKPTPPYQMRRQAVIHIILEQGMTPEKAAILLTVAFHGGTRMGLMQQAESSPVDTCTERVIQDHGLQPQCDFRPCNLFSGRFRFHHHNTERVPSGISLLLDVGDHRLQAPAQSSTDDPMLVEPNDTTPTNEADSMDDATALMQRPRYKAFPRPTSGTSQGITPAPTSSSWFTISQPLAPTGTGQHQPVQWTTIQVRNLADFHTMLQWLSNRAQQDRCQPDIGQAKIATWYLEPQVMPRSDHYRDVLLSANPTLWPSEVLQRWADMLQPSQPVDLYVVQPDPPGGMPDVFAHVIVTQMTPPDQAAALVSVTELLEDPWHPSRFALFLHSPVTSDALFEHAGIPQGQVAATPGLSAYHGTTHIPHGSSYPVRSGFAFEVVTDSLDFEEEGSALLQLSPAWPRREHQTSDMPNAATASSSHAACCEQLIESMRQLDMAIQSITTALCSRTVFSPKQIHVEPHPEVPQPMHITLCKDPQIEEDTFQCHTPGLGRQPDTLHRWQQLAGIRPKEARPMAPIMTWYVDHERFPQCFAPREVFVTRHPQAWKRLILQAWNDIYLPANQVEIVVVQPNPIMMEEHLVAHVIVLQQQMPGFTTALLTTLDSATPGVHRRHATIAPTELSRATLLAIAFHPQECERESNTCDTWVGEEALDEQAPLPLSPGSSCTAALHRHVPQPPGQPDPWELQCAQTLPT